MMRFDRITLGRQAKELGFVRDTFEKVCRLADVLAFLGSDPLLADSLALKGGTAINLTIFDLPRLSVDIDLDFSKDVARESMLAEREQIKEHIQKKYGLFDETQEPLFRRCTMFYAAIASETVPEHFDLNGIGNISAQKVKTDLTPVLRRGERFDLASMQKQVKDYLADILKPEDSELSFWRAFAVGKYQPDLLFDDTDILSRIEHHPMALWKCGGRASREKQTPESE